MSKLNFVTAVYLQDDGFLAVNGTFIAAATLLGAIIVVLTVVGMWKSFNKAGRPGWAALIPFLNFYYVIKISGHPGWWLLLIFVPILNIVIWVMVALDFAYAFKQRTLFGILLFFLPWLMFLILGFGEAQYDGPHPV